MGNSTCESNYIVRLLLLSCDIVFFVLNNINLRSRSLNWKVSVIFFYADFLYFLLRVCFSYTSRYLFLMIIFCRIRCRADDIKDWGVQEGGHEKIG